MQGKDLYCRHQFYTVDCRQL